MLFYAYDNSFDPEYRESRVMLLQFLMIITAVFEEFVNIHIN